MHALTHSLALAAPAEAWGGEPDPYLLEQVRLEAALEEALARLAARSTWKVWRGHLDGAEFYDAEEFRKHIVVSAALATI